MKSFKSFLAFILGFSLSYIPNNYMDRKYEEIALFLVIGIPLINTMWKIIRKN